MRARNTHTAPFNLESGVCEAGDEAEFTGAEFMFLAKMNRAEIVVTDEEKAAAAAEENPIRPLTPAEKGAATKAANAAKKAADQPSFT
ncbi:hypothetical protein DRQ25_10805 [Candidatus Fermentibacteria bacterium]|nr:MAG: hypothetical protein DRQ25_10805 [Candidatus Fermentibacteria bacterium]